MATFLTSSSPMAALPCISKVRSTNCHFNTLRTINGGPMIGGLIVLPKIQITKGAKPSSPLPSCFKTTISCSIAQPETLQGVQGIISKQLSIDESTVTPQTKFADLGADSLDIVEIMMALEEKFEVSIGEGGAENISTVQDAADLVEKVKATSSA
ncbi:acyl carrier protein 1, chloroplastic-like [Corylus avellana]|uniref:acyl carrier protein 1, chloroplastic-like n=1 Tax=Corylus avellana TaxID=13451 RepID=UPI001E2258FF|nr:acyl carrier protein 1, chloroplastic-like [Corylus avellana]